jgi:tetratricopeptide (TPR) repeat protein
MSQVLCPGTILLDLGIMGFRIALVLVMGLMSSAAAAEDVGRTLSRIENRWVDIRYVMTDDKDRLIASRDLREDSRVLLADHPDDLEVKFWHAMVLLLEAEYKRDIGALRFVNRAKGLFEEIEAQNPRLLDGRAYTGLGMLYSDVPAWPIAFGDDKKAAVYFHKALDINPAGQEANYLYADFLLTRKKPAEAIPYFEAALRAPIRPGHERADQFRQKEVEKDLAAARKEIRP